MLFNDTLARCPDAPEHLKPLIRDARRPSQRSSRGANIGVRPAPVGARATISDIAADPRLHRSNSRRYRHRYGLSWSYSMRRFRRECRFSWPVRQMISGMGKACESTPRQPRFTSRTLRCLLAKPGAERSQRLRSKPSSRTIQMRPYSWPTSLMK